MVSRTSSLICVFYHKRHYTYLLQKWPHLWPHLTIPRTCNKHYTRLFQLIRKLGGTQITMSNGALDKLEKSILVVHHDRSLVRHNLYNIKMTACVAGRLKVGLTIKEESSRKMPPVEHEKKRFKHKKEENNRCCWSVEKQRWGKDSNIDTTLDLKQSVKLLLGNEIGCIMHFQNAYTICHG